MKNIFSSIYKLLGLVMAVLIMASCGGTGLGGTTPEPQASDNSLTVIYSNSSGLTAVEAQGTEVVLTFFSNGLADHDNYTRAEIILVVAAKATLSNEGVGLTLIEREGQLGIVTNHDFSGGKTYKYTVTAENGTSKIYTLKAQIKSSDSKAISSFVLLSADNGGAGVVQDVNFQVNGLNITGSVTNTTLTSLIPTIIHNGDSISPASGVAQDFSTNLTYTVTALNKSSQSYTVTPPTRYSSITFDANGGTYPGATPTDYVIYNGNATVLDSARNPSREHYALSGWSAAKNGEAYNFNTSITNATTLYALWTNKRYNVSFNVEGQSSNVMVESLSVLPAESIPRYSCIATWYLDAGYRTPFRESDPITNNLTLYGNSSEALGRLIASKVVPNSINDITSSVPADQEKWRTVMAPYIAASAGKPIEFRYVTMSGGGTGGGTNWANAWGGSQLVFNLGRISDATADKVYVVMVAGGTYKPTTGTARTATFSLKNYVALVGGFKGGVFPDICGSGSTVFSGDIGTPGVNTDNTYRVFNNNNLTNTAVLYGATITGGNNTGSGGGMYNNTSSPTLAEIIFVSNQASDGGGMYNQTGSAPTLYRVTFSENTATGQGDQGGQGGGMYNNLNNLNNSSITLNDVSFISNRTTVGNGVGGGNGGGMNNLGAVADNNTVILNRATFFRNTATGSGGGIENQGVNLTLINTTLSSNSATSSGGGLYSSGPGPGVTLIGVTFSENRAANGGGMAVRNSYMVNTLFWGNTVTTTTTPAGSQILILNYVGSSPTNHIYYSLVQNGISGTLAGGTGGDIGGGFAAQLTSSGSIINIYTHDGTTAAVLSTNPNLGSLAANGGRVLTHALSSGSSAVNVGVHVRKSGDTYYYSSNGTTWYSDPGMSTTATPGDAESLTATDARGYSRSGRPDIGAHESGGTQ